MILIAHRGNTNGKNKDRENSPDYINEAIYDGYDVEVDLWCVFGKLYLGHDYPQYEIDPDYITDRSSSLWVHCKNSDALDYAISASLNCFFHDTDDYTFTHRGFVWAYPGKQAVANITICVMPENVHEMNMSGFVGVCSDKVSEFKCLEK